MVYTIEQSRILGGFTQVELAGRLGMSEKTYIQYEKYRKVFRMDVALQFSGYTKIDITNIIFFEGQLQKNCTKV
jgi:putative transcriptional regulator